MLTFYFGVGRIKLLVELIFYSEEIMKSVDKSILSYLSLCESQSCNGRKYVQDALRERGREVSFNLFIQ